MKPIIKVTDDKGQQFVLHTQYICFASLHQPGMKIVMIGKSVRIQTSLSVDEYYQLLSPDTER